MHLQTNRDRLAALCAAGLALLVSSAPASPPAAQPAGPVAADAGTADGGLADASLEPWRRELLVLAFDAALAIPLHPTLKDRARTQEAALLAALELEQPALALALVDKIPNWRRGSVYAQLAFCAAGRGLTTEVQRLVGQAERIADASADWRRDRIRVGIARTYALLRQDRLAEEFERGVEPAEIGKVDAVRARHGDRDSFPAEIAEIERIGAGGDFDRIRNALETATTLFDRHYADVALRDRVERAIIAAWSNMPFMVRIETALRLSECALRHGDPGKALAMVEEAQQFLDSVEWPAEDAVALAGRVAGQRHRAGDAEGARLQVERALLVYDADRETIGRVFRAGALRPLAEARHLAGDREGARAIYMRSLDEATDNPNVRPRAEDLSATFRSMALIGFEPDETLWARLREIRQDLLPE